MRIDRTPNWLSKSTPIGLSSITAAAYVPWLIGIAGTPILTDRPPFAYATFLARPDCRRLGGGCSVTPPLQSLDNFAGEFLAVPLASNDSHGVQTPGKLQSANRLGGSWHSLTS
jgi:hypothetical protein